MRSSIRSAGERNPAGLTGSPAGASRPGATPDRIGPYRLDGRLGRGGMGEVYRGFDERLQRPVALKRLAAADSSEARRRFRREARSAARLNHSAIVRLYDWRRAGGRDWIVMELVEGCSLRQLIADGRCPPRLAARVGRRIAGGLAAAHDAGLVHRDLKSENVMLTPGGEIRILDFGLAKRALPEDGTPLAERISRTGEVLGTAVAMSPEQALGLPVDPRSDLFSLGVLLYQLLTGVLPFEGPTAVETLTRLCTLDPEPLGDLAPDTPEALVRIVESLLEKDPLRRPPSARTVAEALAAVAREAATREVLSGEAPGGLQIAARLTGEATAEDAARDDTEADTPGAPAAGIEELLRAAPPRTGFETWRPAPGADIPRRPNWRTERRLGGGGFGEAWLGRHRKSGARRVFKFCWDRGRIHSLQREITVFRLLKEELGHRPDIAAIVDWNLDRPPYFLECEHCPGGDLATWLEGRGGGDRVPLGERLEIVAQVADALAAAHSIGVLHKDVKPANVLIAERRGKVQARLGDFGVGAVIDRRRLAAAGITALGLTGEDDSPGTPLYRAPELLEGRAATVQADVYALGVMLYQMVVGDLGHALAPGWRRRVDDPELRADVAAAVEGSPGRRLADAGELARRLRNLEDRRRRRRAGERAARLVEEAVAARRRRRFLLAALAALLVFAATVVLLQQQTAREAERANLEAERARHEAGVAREVSDFLVGMFESSNPLRAGRRAEALSARELLDRGAERLGTGLAGRPEIRARLLATIGSAYVGLGSYDRGEELLRESLRIREAAFGKDALEVADSLDRLRGVLRQGRARRDEIEALDQRALEIRERHLGPDHLETARTALRLGHDYTLAARYGEAAPLLDRALRVFEGELGPDHPEVAEVLAKRAIFHSAQGRLEPAVLSMERAIDVRERHLGPNHTDLIHPLANLAIIYRHQRRFDAGEGAARRALAICEEELGPEHPLTAQMVNNLGSVLVAAGRDDGAEPLLRRALALLEKPASSPLYAARALAGLGTLARRRGDFEAAERFYLRSLELWRDWSRGRARAVEPLHGLAVLRARQGRTGEAEELFRQALDRSAERPDHPRILRVFEDWVRFLRSAGRNGEAQAAEARARAILAR